MHTGRLFALVGVIIGIVGLFLSALRTDGEAYLPALDVNIPTIWGGLDTWAQIVLVVIIVAVVFMALYGARAAAMDRNFSLTTAVLGTALLVYAIVKMLEASDDAEAIQGGFAQAAAAGAIPEAYTVSTGIGFLILIVGTVLVIAGGLSGLRSSD